MYFLVSSCLFLIVSCTRCICLRQPSVFEHFHLTVLSSCFNAPYMIQISIHFRVVDLVVPVFACMGTCADILWIDKLSVSEYRLGRIFFYLAIIAKASSTALDIMVIFVTICHSQRRKLVSPTLWSELSPMVMVATFASILDSQMIVLFPWTSRQYGSCTCGSR